MSRERLVAWFFAAYGRRVTTASCFPEDALDNHVISSLVVVKPTKVVPQRDGH